MTDKAGTPDLAAAVAVHQSGDLAAAEALYRRILKADPDDADALHLLGLVRFDRGDTREAVTLVAKAVARAPGFTTAQRNLANIARASGDLRLAWQAGRRALALEPAAAVTLLGLAGTAAMQDRPSGALLDRAVRLDPGRAAAWQDRAVAAITAGDSAAAERDTMRAAVLLPGHPDPVRNLGWIGLQRGQWENARRQLDRARILAPGRPDVAIALATALTRLGRHDDTLALMTATLARQPAIADAWATLARCRMTLGPADAAARAWRRTLLLLPGHVTAWKGLSAATAGDDDPRPPLWSRRAGMVEPVSLAPATGTPQGTLLVLRALQGGRFWMGDESGFRTSTGNNFIDYVGTDRLARITLYVDYCDHVPAGLPAPTAVCSTVADPDASPLALQQAARLIDRLGLPVVNHPDRVAATRRDLLAETVGPLPGVAFPRNLRIDETERADGSVAAIATRHGLDLPVLARQAGTHTGETLALCRTTEELDAFDAAVAGPVVLSRFVDYADAEGVYRKARVFAIDGTLYPVHWFCAPGWYVRGHEDARRLMRERPELTEEMRRFLDDPVDLIGAEAWGRLEAIAARLDLDFVGIDFSILADGGILVFEANPAMTHHFEFVKEMPFQRPALEAISAAFDRMVHACAAGASAIRRDSSRVISSR